MADWLAVLGFGLITAVATGLGALPFVGGRSISKSATGIANAVAAGLMLGASFRMLYEGFDGGKDLTETIAGAIAGLAFVVISRRLITDDKRFDFPGLGSLSAARTVLILGVMTLHSAAEGIGVGVSFGEGRPFGVFVATAIAIHNIPEGLAISLILVPRGKSAWQAAGWSVLSSLPQPIMAVPAFLLIDAFRAWLPVGFGFAAGAMMWMVFAEMVPEALENASHRTTAAVTTLSLLAMQVIQAVLRV